MKFPRTRLTILVLIVTLSLVVQAQEDNNAVMATEEKLTYGSQKSWIFLETVKTLGNRKSKYYRCNQDTLKFRLSSKTYVGKICETTNPDQKNWCVEELHSTLSSTCDFMIKR